MSWIIPRIWEGGDCWIIGGGASLVKQFNIPKEIEQAVRRGDSPLTAYSPYMKPIQDKHVIGINQAFRLGDWVDVMIFGDFKFYPKNQIALSRYKGIKVSCHNRFTRDRFNDNVRFVPRDSKKQQGITAKKNMVSWNHNTGAAGINLAVHFGVNRIFLLGFDMRMEGEHQHFHNSYRTLKQQKEKNRKGSTPFSRHLRGFSQIKRDVREQGVEIINVNPNSAIEQFPKLSLQEALTVKKGKYKPEKLIKLEGNVNRESREFLLFPHEGILFYVNKKCANTSIKFLARRMYGGKGNLIYVEPSKAKAYKRCKRVMVVRNPYARVVSLFQYTGLSNDTINNLNRLGLRKNMRFEKFVKRLVQIPDTEADIHFISQTFYYGKFQPNVFIKLEKIDEDWKQLNLPELPVHNRTRSGEGKKWQSYFNQDLRNLVYRRYIQDFKLLDYEK